MEDRLHHRLCTTCNARDMQGRPLREVVDEMVAKGETNRECVQFLSQQGVSVTERNFSRHLNRHSAFAKQIRGEDKAIRLIQQYAQKKKQAQSTAQEIINMGGTMIDNWWNKVEGQPQLPITQKLFIAALKLLEGKASKTKWSDRFE